MKLSGFEKAIIFFILMMAIGWVINVTGIFENNTPVTTSFIYQVSAYNANGSTVSGQKVYFMSCLEEQAGWITPASYMNKSITYGYTDSNGYVELDSINYTLYKNDIVRLGASTNETLLESDYANKTFNPGSIGEWTHMDYHNVSMPGNIGDKYECFILVRNSDEKMIDVNQYAIEHGFNNLLTHAPMNVTDYLYYMDKQ
jgi:hypothetical protein